MEMNMNNNNLYKYSTNINLVNFIKEKNDENNISQINYSESNKNNEFLLELANILENKLKANIRLHQKGFEVYKEKILSEKNLILSSINPEIKNLTINQLIDLLTKMKEKKKNEKNTTYFTIGQKMNNNKVNIDQNTIDKMNTIFEDYSKNVNNNEKNNNNGNNNNQFQFNYNKNVTGLNAANNNNLNGVNTKNSCNKYHGCNFDPRKVYHSPSPLLGKKYDSKIIEENKNVNNHINFYEDQKINDNL